MKKKYEINLLYTFDNKEFFDSLFNKNKHDLNIIYDQATKKKPG
jgi:hypothetical protein